jgi:hypothetical protein
VGLSPTTRAPPPWLPACVHATHASARASPRKARARAHGCGGVGRTHPQQIPELGCPWPLVQLPGDTGPASAPLVASALEKIRRRLLEAEKLNNGGQCRGQCRRLDHQHLPPPPPTADPSRLPMSRVLMNTICIYSWGSWDRGAGGSENTSEWTGCDLRAELEDGAEKERLTDNLHRITQSNLRIEVRMIGVSLECSGVRSCCPAFEMALQ